MNIKAVWVICFSVAFNSPDKGPEGSSAATSDNSKFTESIALREKVYNQLLTEQIEFDAAVTLDSNTVREDSVIDCETRLTIEQYDEISRQFDNICRPEIIPNDNTTIITIPVFFYIVTNQLNQNSSSVADVRLAFEAMRSKFSPSKIDLTFSGVDTIRSNVFFDFDANNEFRITPRCKTKSITVFVFNTLYADGAQLNGYTRMQRGADFIMITGNALNNRTTLPHELGHYFLLYHTHGKTNNGTTDEAVARTGCSCSGDDVCDTPADPNLYGVSLPDCKYVGDRTDVSGLRFEPDPSNLMSYANQCRDRFTNGQYNRVRWAALTFRSYLQEPY